MAQPNIETYAKELPNLIRHDASPLQPEDYKSCIQRAADDLSARRPRRIVEDLTSDGTGDFNVAGFATRFEEKFAGEIEVEYPISAAGEKRKCLKPEEFELVRLPDKLVIRVFSRPAAASKIRVSFGARHVITNSSSTIEDEDHWTFIRFAGVEACLLLARHYTPSMERSVMNTDMAIFDNRSKKYADRAKELKEEALNPPYAWGFV